jgi:hypothetical protein
MRDCIIISHIFLRKTPLRHHQNVEMILYVNGCFSMPILHYIRLDCSCSMIWPEMVKAKQSKTSCVHLLGVPYHVRDCIVSYVFK